MTGQNDEQNNHIRRNLNQLIRGLTQNDLTEALEAYKFLFQTGEPVIPQVRAVLLKFDCSKVKYDNEIRYISGLVKLIHDINEPEAKKIVGELKKQNCIYSLTKILDSICQFTIGDYDQYKVRRLKIFEHKRLFTEQDIKATLEKWMKNIPDEDLKGIERIFILRPEDLDNLGNYTPILYQINIVWDNPSSRWSPMSWVNNFLIESTLYHEIGHHVCRHKFGQDPTQEKEAVAYSDRIMWNSGRLIFRLGRLLNKFLSNLRR